MEVSQVEFELQTFGMYGRTYARTRYARTVHGGPYCTDCRWWYVLRTVNCTYVGNLR